MGNGEGRKRVRFRQVEAYYFPRAQGFCAVPSSGGTALGMAQRHHARRLLSLAQHEEELRRKREALAGLARDADDDDEEEEDEVADDDGDGDETESCDEAEINGTAGPADHATNGHPDHLHQAHPELSHASEIPHHHHQEGEEDLPEDEQYYLMVSSRGFLGPAI